MKQVTIRLRNKHKDFQFKPHTSFSNKKHKYLMYRYAYKISCKINIPLSFKELKADMLHGDLIDKQYDRFIDMYYSSFNNNTSKYYITSKLQIPLTQSFSEGMLYDVLSELEFESVNKKKYRDIQQVNEYKISTKITI